METLTKLVFDLLGGGNFLLAFGVLVLLGFFYWKRIYEPFRDYQEDKVKRISDALECDYVEPLTKEFLGEELATLHCRRAVGLGVRRELREAIINKHKSTEALLGFYHFRSALPHLYLENSALKVNITKKQKREYRFLSLIGYVFFAIGVGLWVASLLALYFPPYEIGIGRQLLVFLIGLGILLAFTALSVAFLRLTNPYSSALKVDALTEQSSNDAGSSRNNSCD